MTSKDKAEELNVKFWYLTNDSRIAKQCALIAVEEISQHCYEVMKPFWEEVKQEIEKL